MDERRLEDVRDVMVDEAAEDEGILRNVTLQHDNSGANGCRGIYKTLVHCGSVGHNMAPLAINGNKHRAEAKNVTDRMIRDPPQPPRGTDRDKTIETIEIDPVPMTHQEQGDGFLMRSAHNVHRYGLMSRKGHGEPSFFGKKVTASLYFVHRH